MDQIKKQWEELLTGLSQLIPKQAEKYPKFAAKLKEFNIMAQIRLEDCS